MKAKEKRMILILILIVIVLIVVKVVVDHQSEKVQEENKESIVEEDGTKRIENNKVAETKKLRDLEVDSIEITEKDGLAEVRANITNNTESEKPEFAFTIKLLNKDGEVIQELGGYVGKIKVGETKAINASINMDISEVYDIQFE